MAAQNQGTLALSEKCHIWQALLESYDSNVLAFNIVLEVSEIVLISFNSFFFFPLWFIYFYHSIFYITNPILCLHYSTLHSLQSVFDLIYCSIHYILTFFFFFLTSRSLLNLSCIFSMLVSRLFICNSFFVFKILDHFHYHYLEFFITSIPYLFLFC